MQRRTRSRDAPTAETSDSPVPTGPDVNDETAKHLEFIQAIVARMASHSFLLKGWSVTLVAAVLAIAANQSCVALAAVALLPAVTFWGLDAYYLRQERLFRRLYDAVRLGEVGPDDRLSLSPSRYAPQVPSWFAAGVTPSVGLLHGMIVTVVILVVVVLSLQ